MQDSDGALIISFGKPSSGTGKTLEFCERERKPYLLLYANQTSVEHAAKLVAEFVSKYGINVLNVAGPRAGREPGACRYAHDVMSKYLNRE